MTTTRESISERTAPARPLWLVVVIVWQAVYAVAAAAGTVAIATGTGIETSGVIRWVAVAVMAGAAVLGAASVWWMVAGRHAGRAAAFMLDFLLAIGAGFVFLQDVNVFNGLDALGGSFSRGIPYLGITLLGWLGSTLADKLDNPGLRKAARWTMLAGFAALLIAVGLLPGIWTLLTRTFTTFAIVPFAVAAAGAGTAIALWNDRATDHFGSTQVEMERMNGWLFVSPNVLGFLAFFAGPLIVSLYVSFTDSDGLNQQNWIGLQNYIDLFSDRLFLLSLKNILIFGAIAVPLSVIPAILLANLLNSKLPGMKLFRAIYFLPSIAGVVGVALIWKQIYNASVGYLNFAISRLVDLINYLPGVELTSPETQWLSSPSTALLSVVIVFAFQTIGFNTVLFVAGMQGIPTTLYEAADLDGANAWARFRRITVPLLRPTTVFVVATTTILSLQMFNEPFVLMAPQLSPNGPANATLTPVIYLYQNAFQQFQQGYAAAVAWALFVLIFGITLLYFRRQGDEGVLSA